MLEKAISSIQVQTAILDNALSRLQNYDTQRFNQVISLLQTNDNQRASILADELVELRKMSKMVIQAKLALEQIMMRISTIRDLGEVVVTLGPAISTIKSVKEEMATVTPSLEENFSELSGLLSNILVDAGQQGGLILNFKSASEDSDKILNEASEVAELMMKQKFPDLPLDITSHKSQFEYA